MTIIRSSLRLADAMAARFGILQRGLSADAIIQTAAQRARSDDFGATDFLPGLRTFLDACVAEAELSLVGRVATRWDTLRFLTNLLRLRAAERADPSILDEPITAPVFITGLPRSGTTFLHRLMMEDPGDRCAAGLADHLPLSAGRRRRAGQPGRAGRPPVARLRAAGARVPRAASAGRGVAAGMQRDHRARVPQPALRHNVSRIPSYRSWLDSEGHAPAYRFHKRFLQHLQHQTPWRRPAGKAAPRWVVKCPDHLFALDAIRAVYPDARLVFVHRDPVKVLLSVAKLTEVLRDPFTRSVDRAAIGRQESARWFEGTAHMMAAGETGGFADPICHVHYLDLIADPLATMQSVYGHLGMAMTKATAERIEAFVLARPRGGYAPHSYRFSDHGLDAGIEREKFRSYMLHFGVQPEHERRPRAGAANVPGAPSNGASLRSRAG